MELRFRIRFLRPRTRAGPLTQAAPDQGYYAGEIDGQLGQQTRDALAAYQRDHNLELTAAIDEATVQALGLTTVEEV